MSCWTSARSPASLTDVLTNRLANWICLRQAWQNSVCLSWFMPSVYYKTYLLAVSIALPQSLSLSLPQWLRPLFWCCDSVNQTLLWSAVESRRASINPRFTRERAHNGLIVLFSSRKGMISLPDRNPLLSLSKRGPFDLSRMPCVPVLCLTHQTGTGLFRKRCLRILSVIIRAELLYIFDYAA